MKYNKRWPCTDYNVSWCWNCDQLNSVHLKSLKNLGKGEKEMMALSTSVGWVITQMPLDELSM
jgi:hypothetical protein